MPTQHRHTGASYRSGPVKLSRDGAGVEVEIRPPIWHILKMKAAGQLPTKRKWKTQALIDTGASYTCIRDAIAQELSLKRVGSCKMYMGEGSPRCPAYTAELVMGPFKFLSTVVGIPAKHQKIDCLLGRDLLQRFTFIYFGPTQEFLLYDGVVAMKQLEPLESPTAKR